MQGKLKIIKLLSLLLVILITMILSSCGGNNDSEIDKIEEEVKLKAEQLFPDEEYAKFVEIIEEASSNPNYEADLKALINALDNYNSAVLAHQQKAQMLLEGSSFQERNMKFSSWDSPKNQ